MAVYINCGGRGSIRLRSLRLSSLRLRSGHAGQVMRILFLGQEARNFSSFLMSFSVFLIWHCHIVIMCQPSFRNKRFFRKSRLLLSMAFCCQNRLLVFGRRASLQFGCACQKQPWTNTTVFADFITKSGWPGKDFTFRRYFILSFFKSPATFSSGAVRVCLTWDIISLRLAFV